MTLEVTDDDGDNATDSVVVTVNPANQVTVTASTPRATEAGPINGMFTVTRSGDTSAPLTVHYTVGGTAVAASDYLALPGVATIAVGSATTTVVVTPIDDSAYESNESVILTLIADDAYSVGSPSAGTVTIVSDDLPSDLTRCLDDRTSDRGSGHRHRGDRHDEKSGHRKRTAVEVRGSIYRLIPFWTHRRIAWQPDPDVARPGATNVVSTTLHLPPSTTAGIVLHPGKSGLGWSRQ